MAIRKSALLVLSFVFLMRAGLVGAHNNVVVIPLGEEKLKEIPGYEIRQHSVSMLVPHYSIGSTLVYSVCPIDKRPIGGGLGQNDSLFLRESYPSNLFWILEVSQFENESGSTQTFTVYVICADVELRQPPVIIGEEN